jgi:hypothetical protein
LPAAAKLAPVSVSKDELLELAEWERKYADAKKKASIAEKELKFRRIQLAEKVLGVKSEDELKQLAPDKLLKLFTRRFGAGDWRPEKGAPDFSFSKTNEGRYPSWAQLYVEEMGETQANRIKAETPITYSYCVEVSPL